MKSLVYVIGVLATVVTIVAMAHSPHLAHTQSTRHFDARARTAYSFTDGVGICAEPRRRNIENFWSDVLYPGLQDLGIRHIRCSCPIKVHEHMDRDTGFTSLNFLTSHGIRLLLLSKLTTKAPRVNGGGDSFTEDPQDIKEVVKYLGPQHLDGIEGPNEYYYNNPDPDWPATLYDYTKRLYTAIKSDAATRACPVVGPSLWDRQGRDMGDYTPIVDFGNLHIYDYPYPARRAEYWKPIVKFGNKVYQNRPLIVSETGYNNGQDPISSVTEAEASKDLPRQLLRLFNEGYKRFFIYQFADRGTDPVDKETNGGLEDYACRRKKPDYYTVKNLLHILHDDDRRFEPGQMGFTLTGDLTDIQHSLLQKADGSYYLILWQAVDSAHDPARQPVTLTLDHEATEVTQFASQTSEDPIHTEHNVRTLHLDVPDSPLILRLKTVP